MHKRKGMIQYSEQNYTKSEQIKKTSQYTLWLTMSTDLSTLYI